MQRRKTRGDGGERGETQSCSIVGLHVANVVRGRKTWRREGDCLDGDGVFLLEIRGKIAVVLVGLVLEQEDQLHVVATNFEGFEGRNGRGDAAELGVADEDGREAKWPVEVGLCGAGRARGVHAAGGFDKQPSGVSGSEAGSKIMDLAEDLFV